MNTVFSGFAILDGTALKLIAVITMTIDHIGYILFPQYMWLRCVGRLAFPIFAYMIAEGCYYTKNKGKYLGMVLGIGILCQAAMIIVAQSIQFNIMFTFTFSIALLFSLQTALGRKDVFRTGEQTASGQIPEECQAKGRWWGWILFVLLLLVSAFLEFGLPKLAPGFNIDYGFFGITLALVIYIFPEKWQKLLAAFVWLILLCSIRGPVVQWWCIAALIPLFLYNGKAGKRRMKYFFYLYYPIHLAILWGIYFIR